MAMTPQKASNYDFHTETLHDLVPEVENSSLRTVLHNELVLLNGFFGEVCDYDGIATEAKGNICIDANRTIHTNQVKAALDPAAFVAGQVVYFVPQNGLAVGFLTPLYEATAVPVGIITGADAASKWVEFRPFVQTMDVSMLRDSRSVLSGIQSDITELQDEDVHNPVKIAVATVEAANDGIDLTLAALGMKLGDTIVTVFAKSTADVANATVLIGHKGGAAITNAIDIKTANTVIAAASVAGGVLTADGLTATTASAADKCELYIMYIPA